MTFLNKLVFTVQDVQNESWCLEQLTILTLQDPYADASIGNITGSNSVNVCLVAYRSSQFDGHGWKKLRLNCLGLKYPEQKETLHLPSLELTNIWYKFFFVGRNRFF